MTVKLNLGCGARIWEGFVNVDLANNWTSIQPDVVADITKPLPFPDDHADELHAYHVLEHFLRWDVPGILKEWKRVIKPGGLIVLELPCLDKIVQIFAHALIEGVDPDPRMTMWGLYGDPKYKNEAMTHRWCYTVAELAGGLHALGFVDIEEQTPKTHQPARDMRLVARKPHGDDVQRA